jgi:hypothetical protein
MTGYDLSLRPYHFKDKGKTQNPQYYQGQNQQFADRRSDSMWTMIVDKFYHFHHHRGITLIAGDRGSVAHNEQMYFFFFSNFII